MYQHPFLSFDKCTMLMWWHSDKNLPANAGDIGDMGSIPGWGKIPWRRAWQPAPVFLPGESHGQRSLADYSPQGLKELGMMVGTEHACFSTFHWKSNTASWLIHQTSSKPVQIEAPGFAPEVSFRFPEAMPAHSPADSPRHPSPALGCRMLPYYWECVCP